MIIGWWCTQGNQSLEVLLPFTPLLLLFEASLLCMLKFTRFQALAAAFFRIKIHRMLFLRTSLVSQNCFQIMASEIEVTEISEHLTSSSYFTFPGIATCFNIQKSKIAINQKQFHKSETISVINHFSLGKRAGKEVVLHIPSEMDGSISKACSTWGCWLSIPFFISPIPSG